MSAPVHPPTGAPPLPPRVETAPISSNLSASPLSSTGPSPTSPAAAVVPTLVAPPPATATDPSTLSRTPSLAPSTTGLAPKPAGGPYPISAFVLKQGGAYVLSIVAHWSTTDGRVGKTEKLGGSIGFGHTSYRSLKDKGVPEGAFVRLGCEVTLGKNAEAKDVFIFESSAPTSAYYHAGGTSLSSDKLTLIFGDD